MIHLKSYNLYYQYSIKSLQRMDDYEFLKDGTIEYGSLKHFFEGENVKCIQVTTGETRSLLILYDILTEQQKTLWKTKCHLLKQISDNFDRSIFCKDKKKQNRVFTVKYGEICAGTENIYMRIYKE